MDSILYSMPYLVVGLIYLLLAARESRSAGNATRLRRIRMFCVLLFLFFFGFRGFVGWDWYNYYPAFQEAGRLFSREFFNSLFEESTKEPGFIVYMSLVKTLVPDYHFFIFVSVLIDVLVLHRTFKRYSFNYAFCFLVFFVMSTLMEIDLLRNTKAIMLFLLALPYVEKRRIVPFVLIMLLALSFHLSTIFLMPLYFAGRKAIPRALVIVLLCVGNVIYLSQMQFVTPLVERVASWLGGDYEVMTGVYLASDISGAARGISIGFFERLGTSILILTFYKQLQQRPGYTLFLNMNLISIFIFLLFGEISIIVDRVGLLFVVSYWFIWPELYRLLRVQAYRTLYFIAICMYGALRIMAITRDVVHYRYDNVLFGISSYEDRAQTFDRYLIEKRR